SSATLRRRREDGLFWITRQILRATDNAQRAGILLALPDRVLVTRPEELTEACDACAFGDGGDFIAVRAAAACANREADGQLPAALAEQLERWRRGMVAIAARTRP